ncbi:MAG: hypothetical protein LC746_08225 [Acidobacteria bacterium]|nr:hypothetical protein [Acidobacteriota bacterium]
MPRAEQRSDEPEILTWAEVQRTHRIRNGVYQRDGRLVSLLTDFGRINPCYPDARDREDPDTITYTGAFNKLGAGRWQHTGFWRVVAARHEFDAAENRMLWRFTLKKVLSAEC